MERGNGASQTHIGGEQVRVNHDTLDVRNILVVLEGLRGKGQSATKAGGAQRARQTDALQETSLLAKVGDARAVVVREHFVAEDGVGDLRSVNEVHLE